MSNFTLYATAFAILVAAAPIAADEKTPEAISPSERIVLFNGKDLKGLSTWVKDSKHEDPLRVFRVTDGLLHVTGERNGYIATEKAYRDYHLTVEFKWGKRTDGGKYVRNSGVLLHGVGPDGGANGVWMSCIECQLAQGCVGDLICISGKDAKQQPIRVQLSSKVALGKDKRPRWNKDGEERIFTNKQLWWSLHDPDFQELLDTRGKDDVESPLGEWTKVECVCEGKQITVIVNGVTVNHCYDAIPSKGKILLQSEGFEIFFRNVELLPLKK